MSSPRAAALVVLVLTGCGGQASQRPASVVSSMDAGQAPPRSRVAPRPSERLVRTDETCRQRWGDLVQAFAERARVMREMALRLREVDALAVLERAADERHAVEDGTSEEKVHAYLAAEAAVTRRMGSLSPPRKSHERTADDSTLRSLRHQARAAEQQLARRRAAYEEARSAYMAELEKHGGSARGSDGFSYGPRPALR